MSRTPHYDQGRLVLKAKKAKENDTMFFRNKLMVQLLLLLLLLCSQQLTSNEPGFWPVRGTCTTHAVPRCV